MSVLCSSALGSSLPLLEPAALKGDWQLAAIGDGKTVCEVQLSDEAVANTNAFRFSASAECLQRWRCTRCRSPGGQRRTA
ncbi:protease inhibitor Inh/omp19 family protein [Serratia nematodiphila]|nr:protease inhibitor Inh/omp19 family protein [Serratia nematodiphila]